MNLLKASLRYLLFLTALLSVIWLLFWGLAELNSALLPWSQGLGIFWMAVIIGSIFFITWRIFNFVILWIMSYVARIPVNKKLGYYTVLLIAGLNALSLIYDTWSFSGRYFWPEIIINVLVNLLILGLTFSLILGAFFVWDEDGI